MAEAGVGTVPIKPDFAGFGSAINAEMDRATRSMSEKFTSFGKSAFRSGAIMTTALTAPIALGFKSAFDAASDLNENVSKTRAVFGDASGAIESFARSAATNVGLSESAALDATGSFGNMFTQLGIGADTTADMSTEMVKLAADFASFQNEDISAVIAAQTAAFRGEYDAVQKFVPTINAAAVEQKALAMTGKETTKELTLQEKALATQALLMEGAGDAMGDFARTSDGAANQQRILTAQFQNAASTIGQQLLPVAITLIGWVRDAVTAFAELGQPMQGIILAGAGLLAAIGPIVSVVGALSVAIGVVAGVLGAVTLPMIAVVVGIAALIAAVVDVSGQFDGFRESISSVFTAVSEKVAAALPVIKAQLLLWGSAFLEWVTPLIPLVVARLGEILTAISNWVTSVLPPLATEIAKWGQAFIDWVTPMIPPLLVALAGLLAAVVAWILTDGVPAVVAAFTGMFSELSGPMQAIVVLVSAVMIPIWVSMAASAVANAAIVVASWITTHVQAIASVVVHSAQIVIAVAKWVAMGVAATVNAAVVVAGWVATGVGAIAQTLVMVAQAAVFIARWVAMGVAATAQAAVIAASWLVAMGPIALVVVAVAGLAVAVVKNWDTIKEATGKLVQAVKDKFEDVVAFIKGIPGKITGALGNVSGLLRSAGADLMRGMIAGIGDMAGSLVKKVEGAIGGAISAGKKILGIGSPSKVFFEFGQNTVQGFIDGLGNRAGDLQTTMGDLFRFSGLMPEARSALANTSKAEWVENFGKQMQNLVKVFDSGEDVVGGAAEVIDNMFGNTGKLIPSIMANVTQIDNLRRVMEDGTDVANGLGEVLDNLLGNSGKLVSVIASAVDATLQKPMAPVVDITTPEYDQTYLGRGVNIPIGATPFDDEGSVEYLMSERQTSEYDELLLAAITGIPRAVEAGVRQAVRAA